MHGFIVALLGMRTKHVKVGVAGHSVPDITLHAFLHNTIDDIVRTIISSMIILIRSCCLFAGDRSSECHLLYP
jgi:hypothetical protein